jgi:hypothetical protein
MSSGSEFIRDTVVHPTDMSGMYRPLANEFACMFRLDGAGRTGNSNLTLASTDRLENSVPPHHLSADKECIGT